MQGQAEASEGDAEGEREGRLRAFIRLCRFQFLVPGLALYVLGFLMALSFGARWDPERLVLGYMIFFCAHFSLTFSNDYFDQDADSKNTPTPLSGGSGVLRSHPELATAALSASLILIASSLVLAILFQWMFSPPWYFMALVVAGNLAGFFYSAPPLRLAYRGAGEALTMLAAGVLMPGMGYLCALDRLDLNFLMLTPAFMAYGAFFILSVEMPDVEGDRAGGKRNLLVLLGGSFGYKAALLSVLAGTAMWLVLWILSYPASFDIRLFGAFSLVPLAAGIWGFIRTPSSREGTVRQVKINFFSIMVFLVLAIVYLASVI